MEDRLIIYSNKQKALLLFLGSLAFVIFGFIAVSSPYTFSNSGTRNLLFIRIIGIISVLFFSIGIYVSIKQLIKDRIMLIISEQGIILNPRNKLNEILKWENIKKFSEVNIFGQKIIIIHVDNANYWLAKENNFIKRELMKL